MATSFVNVPLFKNMIMNGAINLKNHHQEVDELNVFPVPDGDTGTNMQMTIMSGVRELDNCQSGLMVDCAKSLSRGCLMGARGNSGVILSQFFRGVYVGVKELAKDQLSVEDFLKVLISGYKVAYKAVLEPVEGTILTVVREAAENCNHDAKSIEELIDSYLECAKTSLANTPNLLPVLKEANVVDSGGTGFVKIIEGMKLALEGKMLEANEPSKVKEVAKEVKTLEFTYCTELILTLKDASKFNESDVKSPLSLLGTGVAVVLEQDTLKVHIHTNHPGRVLEIVQKFGEFTTIKIENMNLQHTHLENGAKAEKKAPLKEIALIAVCVGDGISQTFKDLGVDYIIEGGQTMNPSTQEFVKAVNEVNAKNVIIIPNNSNIVMAAEQAVPLCEKVNVKVLKAKTLSQGYASLMVFDQNESIERNYEQMTEALANVGSGELTYSIRDTEVNGVTIKSGDYIGIANGKIVVSTTDRKLASKELLANLITEDSEIVTIFYGKDVTLEDAEVLKAQAEEINSSVDVELILGKQDIYSFIIAVE